MRNLSILFSVLSFTVFLFGICMYFITKDRNVALFTAITTVLFILSSSFINSLSIQSEDEKIRIDHQKDEEYSSLWRRIDEVNSDAFNQVLESNRTYNSRLDSIWDEVENLKNSSSKRK